MKKILLGLLILTPVFATMICTDAHADWAYSAGTMFDNTADAIIEDGDFDPLLDLGESDPSKTAGVNNYIEYGTGGQYNSDSLREGLNNGSITTETTIIPDYETSQNGGIEADGTVRPVVGDNANYRGPAAMITITETRADGSVVTTVMIVLVNCHGNPVPPPDIPWVSDPTNPGVTGSAPSSSGCKCGRDEAFPGVPPRPADKARPASQSDTGSASAKANVKDVNGNLLVSVGGSSVQPQQPGDEDVLVEMPDGLWENMTKPTNDPTWAKPTDIISFEVTAQAAHIPGYTNSYAKVTTDLNGDEERTDRSGSRISLTPSRPVIAADVGETFTGTAEASPIFASLTWTPVYDDYVRGYNPATTRCSYREVCGSSCCGRGEDGKCNSWCDDYCTYYCSYISDWKEETAKYIRDWSPSYSDSGSINKIARIRVEYNYDPEPETPEQDDCLELAPKRCANHEVKYAGEDVEFRHSIKTLIPEKPASNGQSYSTNSLPSAYEIISFITTPESSAPKGAGIGASYPSSVSTSNPRELTSTPRVGSSCDYYAGSYEATRGRGCIVVQRENNVFFNTNGGVDIFGNAVDRFSYDINGNQKNSLNLSLIIDDIVNSATINIPLGSKFCTAISVWPAGFNGLKGQFNGGSWKHSDPYCVTIAKKPSVQFQGAGVYADGNIITSQSVKYIPSGGNGFTANSGTIGRSDGNNAAVNLNPEVSEVKTKRNRVVFGSWGEYEILSGHGSIKRIGSGAAFGYSGVFSSHTPNNSGHFISTHPNASSFATNRACSYSTQTISNFDSSPSATGGCANLGHSLVTPTTTLISQIKARYETAPCTNGDITVDSTAACFADTESVSRSYSSRAPNTTLRVPNTVPKGRTYTITGTNTITIASDIKYDDNASYDSIFDLPQVIIIAPTIKIAPNVERIDAWLIATGDPQAADSDAGSINTCTGFTVGVDGSDNACDRQLIVNGPVFADKLILNRFAGAGAGQASDDPAEVFNLRADSYLWAYAQTQRFSQAVVTYSRELAPRY